MVVVVAWRQSTTSRLQAPPPPTNSSVMFTVASRPPRACAGAVPQLPQGGKVRATALLRYVGMPYGAVSAKPGTRHNRCEPQPAGMAVRSVAAKCLAAA